MFNISYKNTTISLYYPKKRVSLHSLYRNDMHYESEMIGTNFTNELYGV